MKNNIKGRLVIKTVFMLLLSVGLFGCNRSRNNPGWDYFPDMFYSTAYKTNTPNPNFIDGMTMRVPVKGTIPREFTPFEYTIDTESRIKAGKELINPILRNDESLASGKAVYTIFCLGCHGIEGDGNGHLYKSGLYSLKPRSLITDTAIKLKDGEIYHSITLGFGAMGAHGSQIRTNNRWMLILYIRKLQEESKDISDIKKGGNN